MDILLTHGYYLSEDPHEQSVMKPYPPLGVLSLSAYLKTRGFSVAVFDTTFQRPADFAARLVASQPTVVGIYATLMTKFQVLAMITTAKRHGS